MKAKNLECGLLSICRAIQPISLNYVLNCEWGKGNYDVTSIFSWIQEPWLRLK